MSLTHTVRSVKKALKQGALVFYHDTYVYYGQWMKRDRVVSNVRFHKAKVGAGWLEVQIGGKRPRWVPVMADSDLEIEMDK